MLTTKQQELLDLTQKKGYLTKQTGRTVYDTEKSLIQAIKKLESQELIQRVDYGKWMVTP